MLMSCLSKTIPFFAVIVANGKGVEYVLMCGMILVFIYVSFLIKTVPNAVTLKLCGLKVVGIVATTILHVVITP